MAGAVAAVLLLTGGLEALQTAAIASALPFAAVMLFICYGLLRALQMEGHGSAADLLVAVDGASPASAGMGWQQRLASIIQYHPRSEILEFLADTARPALAAVAAQMRESGLSPELHGEEDQLDLSVPHGDRGVFRYSLRVRGFRSPSFAWAEPRRDHGAERQHYRTMAHSSEGDQPHDVTGYDGDQLINDLLNRYARFRHSRRLG